jgi:hypothetical protein
MPYGLPKDLPQPESDQKVERCVTKLVARGEDKTSAIRICKASLIKSAKKRQG